MAAKMIILAKTVGVASKLIRYFDSAANFTPGISFLSLDMHSNFRFKTPLIILLNLIWTVNTHSPIRDGGENDNFSQNSSIGIKTD